MQRGMIGDVLHLIDDPYSNLGGSLRQENWLGTLPSSCLVAIDCPSTAGGLNINALLRDKGDDSYVTLGCAAGNLNIELLTGRHCRVELTLALGD